MQITNIHEAKTPLAEGVGERSEPKGKATKSHEAVGERSEHFSKLINRVLAGEEVIIGKAGKPVAKLIPYDGSNETRRGGQWRGKVKIAEDFDELPEHLAAAFREGTV